MSAFGVVGRDVIFRFSPEGFTITTTNLHAHFDSNYFDYHGCRAAVSIKLGATDVLNLVHNWGDGDIITLTPDADGTRLVFTYEAEDFTYVRVRGVICLPA